jgi:hypothetical protein
MSRAPTLAPKLLIHSRATTRRSKITMRKHTFYGILALVSLLALGITQSARASAIYDNLSASTTGSDIINGFGPLYDSFTSAGSSQTISGLDLRLTGVPGTQGQTTVGLYSDSGTSPGALIAILNIINDATITAGTNNYSLSLLNMPLLAASTRYWIGLSDTGTAVEWAWSLDTSGVGVSGEYFANASDVFPNDLGPYQMRLSTSSSVPDAGSTLPLLGFASLGLVALRRKLRC